MAVSELRRSRHSIGINAASPTPLPRVVTDDCDSAIPSVYSGAMRRMDRYILGQIFWWTIFVSTCLICVVWLSQSLQFVEMIVNRGLSIALFVYFTALMLPTFMSMILPIALPIRNELPSQAEKTDRKSADTA